MNCAELVGQLVAIDSVNPALSTGAPGERAITDFVAAWLADHGVDVVEIPSGDRDDGGKGHRDGGWRRSSAAAGTPRW